MHAPRQPEWLRALPVNLLPWGAKTFWALFGGTIVLLAMRLVVVSQLKAEVTSRISSDSALEVHGHTTAERLRNLSDSVSAIRTDLRASTKAICLDHTKAEQARIFDIDQPNPCPPNLFKGAH